MAGKQFDTVVRHLHRLSAASSSDALTDRQLLKRFAVERDEQAFAFLVRRHGAMVLGVCRRMLHQAQDAEDVFQATFLVLARKAVTIRWQVRGRLADMESPFAWLSRRAEAKHSPTQSEKGRIVERPTLQYGQNWRGNVRGAGRGMRACRSGIVNRCSCAIWKARRAIGRRGS